MRREIPTFASPTRLLPTVNGQRTSQRFTTLRDSQVRQLHDLATSFEQTRLVPPPHIEEAESPSRIWWGNVLFCSTNAARVVGTGKVRVLAEIAWSGLNGFQVAKIQLAMPDGSSFPNVAPRPPVAGRPLSQKKPAVPEPSCWWAPAIRTCLCPTWWLVIRAETLVCL